MKKKLLSLVLAFTGCLSAMNNQPLVQDFEQFSKEWKQEIIYNIYPKSEKQLKKSVAQRLEKVFKLMKSWQEEENLVEVETTKEKNTYRINTLNFIGQNDSHIKLSLTREISRNANECLEIWIMPQFKSERWQVKWDRPEGIYIDDWQHKHYLEISKFSPRQEKKERCFHIGELKHYFTSYDDAFKCASLYELLKNYTNLIGKQVQFILDNEKLAGVYQLDSANIMQQEDASYTLQLNLSQPCNHWFKNWFKKKKFVSGVVTEVGSNQYLKTENGEDEYMPALNQNIEGAKGYIRSKVFEATNEGTSWRKRGLATLGLLGAGALAAGYVLYKNLWS